MLKNWVIDNFIKFLKPILFLINNLKNIKSCWNDQIIQLMKSQKNEFQEWVNKNSTNYQFEQQRTNLIEPAPNASYVEPLSKLFSFKFGKFFIYQDIN